MPIARCYGGGACNPALAAHSMLHCESRRPCFDKFCPHSTARLWIVGRASCCAAAHRASDDERWLGALPVILVAASPAGRVWTQWLTEETAMHTAALAAFAHTAVRERRPKGGVTPKLVCDPVCCSTHAREGVKELPSSPTQRDSGSMACEFVSRWLTEKNGCGGGLQRTRQAAPPQRPLQCM